MTSLKQYDLYLGHNHPQYPGNPITSREILRFIRGQTLLSCYTLIKAQGAWDNEIEDTTILRIIEAEDYAPVAREIARNYKHAFSQQAVLLTITNLNESVLI
jgi:hypothetical protein